MEETVQRIEMMEQETKVGSVQRYLICGYFLLAFFEPYLNGALGAFAKYYILLLISVLCISYRFLNIRPFHWCFLGWLLFKIISMLWTTDLSIPKLHMFSQIGMVGLLIMLTSIPLDKKTINSIVNTMWLGSATIGVLSLFLSHPYHGVVATRQVLYLFGQEADPNNQAAFLLVGLTISLYNLMSLQKYRIISFATIAVNAYVLFMTGSRGGLVGLACVGIVLFLVSGKEGQLWGKLKLIVVTAIICFALFFIANEFLPEDIFERIFNLSSYDGGSERDIIWKNGWKLFTSDFNFLFGAGWGAYYGYNGFFLAMHNTFLSMLCDVGVFGCLIFFTPILKACLKLLKKHKLLPVLLLVCGFVPCLFIDAINKRFFWNAIFILFIYLINDEVFEENN